MADIVEQRVEGDRYGISLSWDGFLVSGMSGSIDEVRRLLAVVEQLEGSGPPDSIASLKTIWRLMIKVEELEAEIDRLRAKERRDG